MFAELSYGVAALEFWAKNAPTMLADEIVETASPFISGGRKLKVRYEPVGVVGVIGPWNFPLINSFGDCIPALAAGNAVVLKPSEITPLTSLLMAEMLDAAGLPEGVFTVATGLGTTGAALVDLVDYVMFTGSVKTGKRVMAQAAETLTPVSLELGGKDPMIVLSDADLERAVNAAVSNGLNNSGQVCISVERIYVEDSVHDEFVDRLTEKVEALRQGPPGELGSVDVGAIIFPPQIDLIDAHVRDAVERGAEVRTGGTVGRGTGPLLRADRPDRCRPHDALHDRGDLRPDAAGHEGGRRRGGGRARQRRPLRPAGLGLDPRRRARRGPGPPDRGGGRLRQRRAAQLRRHGAADGRLEGVGPRLPPRRRRDPQVHEAPVAADHARATRRRASSTGSPTSARSPRRSATRSARSCSHRSSTTPSERRSPRSATPGSPRWSRPRARADPTGFWARSASDYAIPVAVEIALLQSGAPEEQLEGLRGLLAALAAEGMAAGASQEVREAIVNAFMADPEAAVGLDALRGVCLSLQLRAAGPGDGHQPELARHGLPGPAGTAEAGRSGRAADQADRPRLRAS